MGDFGIGAAVRRKEDFRFLTGQGTYTDDINRPGQLYAFLLRSPHAHAELGAIDTAAANAAPGVSAVFTGADLQVGGLPCGWLVTSKDGKPMIEPPHPRGSWVLGPTAISGGWAKRYSALDGQRS
jgi:carbon-monoxide dehydrogenase large subunit